MKGKKGLATLGEVAATHRGAGVGAAAMVKEKETFAVALKRLRLEFGYSHRDVANMAKVPTARVRAWEDGEENPTKREFRRVCFILPRIEHYAPESFEAPRSVREAVVGKLEERDDKAAELRQTIDEGSRRFAPYVALDDSFAVENSSAAPMIVVGESGEVEAAIERRGQDVDVDAEVEAELGKAGAAARTNKIRQIARSFLENAPTEENRQERLEAIRLELPRSQRRALGIPSPDAVPPFRPPPRGAARTFKCPRCQAETVDLKVHRGLCPNVKVDWNKEGWRTCKFVEQCAHVWNVQTGNGATPGGRAGVGPPPDDAALVTETCPSHRPAAKSVAKKTRSWELDLGGDAAALPEVPEFVGGLVARSPASSGDDADRKAASEESAGVCAGSDVRAPPTAPDSGPLDDGALIRGPGARVDGLALAERCLVLADMLWPAESHHLVIWFAAGVWNVTVENTTDEGRAVRSGGTAVDKHEAVRALADALRAETKERARAAEDMARLLED